MLVLTNWVNLMNLYLPSILSNLGLSNSMTCFLQYVVNLTSAFYSFRFMSGIDYIL